MWADIPLDHSTPAAIYLAAKSLPSQSTKPVATAEATHKLGRCFTISMTQDFYPIFNADAYFERYLGGAGLEFQYNPDGTYRTDAVVTLTVEPKHGTIVKRYPDATDFQKYKYQYIANDGFDGDDHFVMDVTAGDKHVQIYYTFRVVANQDVNINDWAPCEQETWKISSLPTGTDSTTITYSNLLNGA